MRKIREDEPNPVPFTSDEILRMDAVEKTSEDDLVYKLFRHTGMRRSDVADLKWTAIDWSAKVLTWTTRKQRKQVVIPLVPVLYEALEKKYTPELNHVLESGYGPIYGIIKGIGEAAKVEDCHPHRFRTTLATELLAKGATLFDVAAILGDTPATVDRYYGAHTQEQRERIRDIMIA
jgi:integrase